MGPPNPPEEQMNVPSQENASEGKSAQNGLGVVKKTYCPLYQPCEIEFKQDHGSQMPFAIWLKKGSSVIGFWTSQGKPGWAFAFGIAIGSNVNIKIRR